MIAAIGVVHVPEGLDFISLEWLAENISKPVMPEGILVVSLEKEVHLEMHNRVLGEALYVVCADALKRIRKDYGLCAADLEVMTTNTFGICKIHCYGYRR